MSVKPFVLMSSKGRIAVLIAACAAVSGVAFVTPPALATPVTAVTANAFLNSLGVDVHIGQGADNPTQVGNALVYTGIRNFRDDPGNIAGDLTAFDISGAKVDLLPVDGNVSASIANYEQLAAQGALLAAEGPNEPNNEPVTYDGQTSNFNTTFMPVAEFQAALYSAVKADPKLAGIPVFASSEAGGSEPNNVGLQYLTIPDGADTLMPAGTQYADYANTHNYLVGNGMTAPVDNNAWYAEDPNADAPGPWDGMESEYGVTWHEHFTGYSASQLPSVPRVTTETGWTTQGTNSVTQAQQGDLFLNLYLDAYKEGWSYTFIYMLNDSTSQGYWGLYNTNGTPKLSATYIHNLTTILADKTSFTPGSLNFSIPNEPVTVHDLLLEKSNGMFALAVWDENVSGTNTVTVNLGSMYGLVNIYDPTVGTSAVQTLTNVSSVSLTLSDHPEIIEVPVPEPATLALLAIGGGALALLGKRAVPFGRRKCSAAP